MSKIPRLVSLTLFLALVLGACNLPSDQKEDDPKNADTVLTAAAQTVEANLTQSALLNPPTVPVIPTSTIAIPSATVVVPTSTVPAATDTPICDLAQFIKDVNIPDGTEFKPNDTFTKTWRLKNIGVCTWSGYSLVFDSGDAMGGSATTPIGSVATNQEIEVSVNLKAPATDGSYRGYWRIKNSAGVLIPISGGYQSKSFFVDIKVKTPAPASKPDLYISQITYNPPNPHKGDTITIKVSVYNGGNAPAGPSTAEWWPAVGYPNAECTWAVDALVANGGKVYTCTYVYAGWSTYTTSAIADTTDAVDESNETNNTLQQVLPVGP